MENISWVETFFLTAAWSSPIRLRGHTFKRSKFLLFDPKMTVPKLLEQDCVRTGKSRLTEIILDI
jgi:hypothetical protein